MEKYSSGRRGAPAKGVGRVTGAEVQIFSSPPNKMDRIFPVLFILFGGEGFELQASWVPPARKGDSLVKGNVVKRQKVCALPREARAPSGKDKARNKEWQSSKNTTEPFEGSVIG